MDAFEDMAAMISDSKGQPITFTIQRGTERFSIDIPPARKDAKNIFGEDIKSYAIGVASSAEHILSIPLNPAQAFYQSLGQTYDVSKLMFVGIYKLVKGDISPKTLGGPIMIAQMAGDQAKEGIPNLIYFIAFISINLAIVNFLPIPVLDGGHLLFFTIEAISGSPISLRMREITQQIGVVVLLLLTVFVFYNDIVRIFFK